MADTQPTLIIGDFTSRCGVCGEGADPDELRHRTILPGWRSGRTGVGCGAVWTRVAPEAGSRIGAEARIREMRPDLTLVAEREARDG